MYYYVLTEDYYIVDKDENYPSIIYGVDKQKDYRITIAYSDNKFDMSGYIRTRYSLIHRIKIKDVSLIKIRCNNESELLYMLESDHVLAYMNNMIISKMSHDDKYVQYMTIEEWRYLSIDSRMQIYEYIENAAMSIFRLIVISKYLKPDMIDTEFLIRYLQYILYKYIKPSIYNHIFRPNGTIEGMPMDLVTWITRIGGPDNVICEPF